MFKAISNSLNFVITVPTSLLIAFKASGIEPNEPSSLSIIVPKLSKASEKVLIILTGIPTPGGNEVGIGSCLITVTPTFTPVRTVSDVEATLFKVAIYLIFLVY